MNKAIPTENRIFMAVIGPSGCGKTDLIVKIFHEKTFFHEFDNVVLLYREKQINHVMFERIWDKIFKCFNVLYFGF